MTGFRDGQALESQALAHGKETLQGGNAGALSQGTLQVPSPCEEQLVEMADRDWVQRPIPGVSDVLFSSRHFEALTLRAPWGDSFTHCWR